MIRRIAHTCLLALAASGFLLPSPALSADKKNILFVAGRDSHGRGSHEHTAGCKLLAKAINESGLATAEVHVGGWPKDWKIFEGRDAVVIYCDGGGGHVVKPHLGKFSKIMDSGVGLACLHYGVEIPKGDQGGSKFKEWIGGYFETHWSVNPHWTADIKPNQSHPISNGVKPFSIRDEWYFHMRFQDGMKGVTPIFSAVAPKETMKRGDGAHSGNQWVRKAVAAGEAQHIAWAYDRPNGGRGFGFTGGHFHKNWEHDGFRKAVLNAIIWIAKGEVPAKGVESKKPDLGLAAPPPKKSAGTPDKKKAAFASKVITKKTPGQGVDIKVDIKGKKELWLVATDGGNGFACDWANWVEPTLSGPAGTKKLTDLKWKMATTGFGQVRKDSNNAGQPMKAAGKSLAWGIGAHATSVIAYDLPGGYTTFTARGVLDDGGANQGNCGDQASIEFLVFTSKPPMTQLVKKQGGGQKPGGRTPEEAVGNLEVHESVEATLWAHEPMMLSPSSIDIDHQGRIWVCEIINYRRHKGKRPEGDRILVLEDSNGDGKADKSTVFYQGTDIDSPHGVCVLGDKVIVSAGDKVLRFTDANGDLKADGTPEIMFTGISGSQHDHGIHAFMFGPDGKLYFNFGNSGNQIKDAAGKIIVDKAGNEVTAKRKPYQQGMVFRCNMDGSGFETLGWNFRNNWEVTVDSFGTLWQSDNDDDGNKGVRINYVMEFGNYGYRDEFTGGGWRDKRTNIEKEIPLRHWHLNDPGVVPNLLQTGQGSPTGILVYEGALLPKVFRNQMIHCDAGPSIVRAYPVTNDGAGYKAEVVNILDGAKKDRWFRPADVSVAPDGALYAADWYDPGVGGHAMGDLDRGRIFRVAPKGHKSTVPKFDLSTAEGAAAALASPNNEARYLGWTALHGMGKKALPALARMAKSDTPHLRARATWLSGKIQGASAVAGILKDRDPNIRIVGIRLARQLGTEIDAVKTLVKDPDPQVRRECAIALRHSKDSAMPGLWAELAAQHTGSDRWYLEALGLSSDLRADECFAAWETKVGGNWDTAGGRDIVWRVRSTKAPDYIAKVVTGKSVKPEEHPRFMRAFDFHKGPEKDAALKSVQAKLLGL